MAFIPGARIRGDSWIGMEAMFASMSREINKLEKVTVDGLIEAGLYIKGEAQRLTPVDTANLKASAYVIWGGGKTKGGDAQFGNAGESKGTRSVKAEHPGVVAGRKAAAPKVPFVEIGFTAHYALEVHELVDNFHLNGQAKFLEQAMKNNRAKILSIIKRRAGLT